MKRLRRPGRAALAGAVLLAAAASSHGQTSHTIDVLGIYSDDAAARISDPAALFVRNIEYANRALANSQANYRYNLVGVEQRSWANDGSLGSTQLQSFQADAGVRALREQYGADLVAGIVPSSSGLCGIGYLPISSDGQTIRSYSSNYAYSLTGHNCGGRSMAHEMGHNTGLGHSAAQGSSGTFGHWARGHGVQGSFVTIMAYNSAYGVYSSAGVVQMHANPGLSTCRGLPCGVVHTRSDGADAVRALNMASPQIADYTESSSDGPVNLPPEAEDDAVTTDEDQAVTFDVLGNDSDPDGGALTLVGLTPPGNGTASVQSPAGTVRYVPARGFFGVDRFDYTVRDAGGETATAAVTVTVNEVLDPGTPPAAPNLVVNGDAEAGLDGWQGLWGTTAALATPGLEGAHSVRGTGGYAVIGELRTPISGGRRLELSATLQATASNRVYAYLRILQNGRWLYQYVTGADLVAGRTTGLRRSFNLGGGDVTAGYVMFYFPYRIQGAALIDEVQLSVE